MTILRLVLLIQIIILASCGCPHHPYETLASETDKWTRLYNSSKVSVFKNSSTEYDTIATSFKDTTLIWSASAECNFPCQSSIVKMQSRRFNFHLKVTTTYINRVAFDSCLSQSCYASLGEYNVDQNVLMPGNNLDAKIDLNYSFHGKFIKVLELTCKTGCAASFSKIIYSREFGLIEVVDNQSATWTLN